MRFENADNFSIISSQTSTKEVWKSHYFDPDDIKSPKMSNEREMI